MTRPPRGIILLCAGRGTRMRPLTEQVPKCMLRVGKQLVIDYLLDSILARTTGEVVAVTGFAAERLEAHLASRVAGRVAIAYNDKFETDTNILSTEIGVSALHAPEHGYLIVETDLLLEEKAWDRIFAALETPESFWLCKDYYTATLTGGIVHADASGRIDAVEYAPLYDEHFNDWPKMVGMLGVAPDQVAADRHYRHVAISRSVAQYYLMPWQHHLPELPCKVLQIDDCFAKSFNTPDDFTHISKRYLDMLFATISFERP